MRTMHMVFRALTAFATFAALAYSALATAQDVDAFTPQGEVALVRQVTARFSEQMVQFGDPRAASPFEVQCSEKGAGRWIDGRNWSYDFERDVPAGVRCKFSLRAGLRTLRGKPVRAQTYAFSTGGPKVVNSYPPMGSPAVHEDQRYLLELNVAPPKASILQHVRCRQADGAKVFAVEVLSQTDVASLAKANGLSESGTLPRLALRCKGAFAARDRYQVVWGKGVAAQSGVSSAKDQFLDFTVRPEFTARVSCRSNRAIPGCSPDGHVSLDFSASVPRKLAERIRVQLDDGKERRLELNDLLPGKTVIGGYVRGPFPVHGELVVTLPDGFRDIDGRSLYNSSDFPAHRRIGEPPPSINFVGEWGIVELGAGGLLPVRVRNVEAELQYRSARLGRRDAAPDDADVMAAWIASMHRNDPQAPRPKGFIEDAKGIVRKRLDRYTFENLPIGLGTPGVYRVEIDSPLLTSYLKPIYPAVIDFAQTTVLVTNLAVHFKYSSSNALVWVTKLDSAEPVPEAEVALRDCSAKLLWRGRTDSQGLARINKGLSAGSCSPYFSGYFVSARSGVDYSFTVTNWVYRSTGFRPNYLATGWEPFPTVAHTVMDRPLYRAGETVSMRHFVRQETPNGLSYPGADGEDRPSVAIVHATGARYDVKAAWDRAGNGESEWRIPLDARLGTYQVEVSSGNSRSGVTSFRVEEFRVPSMVGTVTASAKQYFAAREVPYHLRLAYLSGGPARQAVRLRSSLLESYASFDGYEDFMFSGHFGYPPAKPIPVEIVRSLELDPRGEGSASAKDLPQLPGPAELTTEMEFEDANGEVQSVSSRLRLWPSALALGLRHARAKSPNETEVRGVALDLDGRALPNINITLRGALRTWTLDENRQSKKHDEDLGSLCAAKSDAYGLFSCSIRPARAGEILITAEARDAAGNMSRTTMSLYQFQDPYYGASTFPRLGGQEVYLASDRVQYEPGDTARLKLEVPRERMSVLVTREREGLLEAKVLALEAGHHEFEVPLKAQDAPNTYVSALLIAGRRARGAEADLSDPDKPAFFQAQRELRVAPSAFRLSVAVSPERPQYRPRERASIRVRVTDSAGKSARGAEIALAVVDEALLELRRNTSLDILAGMFPRREPRVDSATGISQVFGLRFVPPSEDGAAALAATAAGLVADGRATSLGIRGTRSQQTDVDAEPPIARELFDSLVLWRGRVKLDANGETVLDVPLNDSVTTFRIFAVASAGTDRFGAGEATVQSSTPYQILAGLPPLVRDGDRVVMGATLRNLKAANARVEFEVVAQPAGNEKRDAIVVSSRNLDLKAGESTEVAWPFTVPPGAERILWTLSMRDPQSRDRDSVRITQRVSPAVPVTVQQATLTQLQQPFSLKVAMPAEAIPGRGGVSVGLRYKLADGLGGFRNFTHDHGRSDLEWSVSRAVATRDPVAWQAVLRSLPKHQDSSGLFRMFAHPAVAPSEVLTAYIVSVTHQAGLSVPQEVLQRALKALGDVVDGRLKVESWSPRPDREARRLTCADALSRHRVLRPEQIPTLVSDPNALPTSALLDWIDILRRTEARKFESPIEKAQQILRARLNLQGTVMTFSTEASDYLWWLMTSTDSNAARAILTVLPLPGWNEDVPRMVRGAITRQKGGTWITSVANAWGVLAMESFSQKFESREVVGTTSIALDQVRETHDWRINRRGGDVRFAWPAKQGELTLSHQGQGHPWLTVQSYAAVPLKAPFFSGYRIVKRISAVEKKNPATYSRGDVIRVTLEIEAQSDMTWVAVADPIPAGASILGRGLDRDSRVLTQGERRKGWIQPAYQQHTFEGLRAYYAFMPKGKHTTEYTVRLSSAGEFLLPQTRVEAMYAPEMHGELPNVRMTVLD